VLSTTCQGKSRLVKGRVDEESEELAQEVPQVDPQELIYAIGDIHGRDDLLLRLFEKIGDDIASGQSERVPRVIFLGDYIDRGDHSREVVYLLMAIRDELGDGAVFLRGNHEAALLSFIDDPLNQSDWLRFGGLQTLGSYKIKPPAAPLDNSGLETVAAELADALGPQLEFFRKTELMAQSGGVVFAHAGVDPSLPLDQQSEDALLWGNSEFIKFGGVPNLRVVHGHYDGPEVISMPGRVCVDTGAYYTGRLSAVRLDDDETVIVATNSLGV